MKVQEIFEVVDTLNDPGYFEYRIKNFYLTVDKHDDTIPINDRWVGGPMTSVFDCERRYHLVLFHGGGPGNEFNRDLKKAVNIINRHLENPNRQQAKSECTEELFNAGLKDYI